MNKILLFLILLGHSIIFAQVDDIEIIEKAGGKGVVELFAKNNTADELDATIDIKLTGYIRKNGSNPTKIILEPGAEKLIVTLSVPPDTRCGYETSISYRKTSKVNASGTSKKETRFTSIQINPTKINVFTQDGCGRCAFVVNYFETNKIPFTELNTTIHAPNQDLMFEQLEKAGFKGSSIQMPVIVHNDKTFYDIKNLQKFVEDLK